MAEKISIAVIIPAAGQGTRFGPAPRSKLEHEIAGRSVLVRSVELFGGRPEVAQIIVGCDPEDVDGFKFKWGDKLGFLGVKIVPGGKTERWETVANCLKAVDDTVTHVAIHDAARPVADGAMINRLFEAAGQFDAVVPTVPVNSTVKRLDVKTESAAEADPMDAILGSAGKKVVQGKKVIETVPRGDLELAQTPQVVARQTLIQAFEQLASGKIDAGTITDDVGMVEAMGLPVHAVPGDVLNVKITVPDDLKFAEAVLKIRKGSSSADDDPFGPKRKFPTWAESEDD